MDGLIASYAGMQARDDYRGELFCVRGSLISGVQLKIARRKSSARQAVD